MASIEQERKCCLKQNPLGFSQGFVLTLAYLAPWLQSAITLGGAPWPLAYSWESWQVIAFYGCNPGYCSGHRYAICN